MSDRKVPWVRFQGFREEWINDTLGKITDVYDGTHQTPKYTENGIMFLSVENIKTLYSNKYISESDFINDFKIFPQKNDILMTRIGDIGTANVVDNDTKKAYYVSLALLKYKRTNPYFLSQSIHSQTVKREIWHRTLHIAFPKKINKNEIEKINILLPNEIKEQTKIGEFFKNLDNLIAQNQNKYNKLVNMKKAYLDKMFPKDGADIPEVRFKGFGGKWNKERIFDLGNIVTGSTPPTNDKSNYGNDYLFVSPVDINDNRYIQSTVTKLSKIGFEKGRILKSGSILFVSIGSTIGKVAQTNVDVTTNQQINAIEPNEFHCSNFIYSMMSNISKIIKKSAGTQAVPIVNKTSFSNFPVCITKDYKEQTKIGEFFKTLDNLITLQKTKLEKLKNIKKACLDKMFI